MSVLLIMLAVNKCVPPTYQAHTCAVVMTAFNWTRINTTVVVCKLTSYIAIVNLYIASCIYIGYVRVVTYNIIYMGTNDNMPVYMCVHLCMYVLYIPHSVL